MMILNVGWRQVIFLILWGFFLLLLLFLPASLFAADISPTSYLITSVQAFLYYDHNGKLSENIIDNPDFHLWNTIIGEGSAEGASNETLVVVEITGEPGVYEPDRKVEFIIQVEGKTILKFIREIGILSDKGKYYLPFLLYDTGCFPINIVVKITGQSKPSQMKKTINFQCGE
ncbi:MAG: hypothetical protein NTX88_03350 [Candidatus Atribacteria bacterium]|nr:hypothetical protein [Candidatus Atribacteria bacterium]